MSTGFLARLEQVHARIEAAAGRSGRSANAVTLVAVTKTYPAEVVQAAYAAGLREFGENRVEALRERRRSMDLPGTRWHMIGHIQSRKARDLIGLCDLVHSVDRLGLAEELSRRTAPYGESEERRVESRETATHPHGESEERRAKSEETATHPPAPSEEGEHGGVAVNPLPLTPYSLPGAGQHGDGISLSTVNYQLSTALTPYPLKMNVLLQVNVSGEESKGGWQVTGERGAGGFLEEAAKVAALPGLRIRGLMTMAPFYENPELTRPIFARLRRVQEQLQTALPELDVGWLSMGMTNDFEIAIEEGATHVRIGTALFGERE